MNKKQFAQIKKSVESSLLAHGVKESTIDSVIQRIAEENPTSSWWVILLKVLAYAIGLILAGVGTSASAMVLTSNIF